MKCHRAVTMNIPHQEMLSAAAATPLDMMKTKSTKSLHGLSDYSPGGQVESCAEAAEDLDLGLGPEAADGGADAPDHRQPRRVLLRRRNHELEKVLDLLVQPATKKCSQWIMCPIIGLVNSGCLQNFRISSLLSA